MATIESIFTHLTGKEATSGALSTWRGNYNALPTIQRAEFYNDMVAAINFLEMTDTTWPRLISDFVGIRKGSGALQEVITKINTEPGVTYSSEFDANEATDALFGKHKPTVLQAKIATPRRWTKPGTIQEEGIESSSLDGALELANGIQNSLRNSETQDEYVYFVSLLMQFIREGGAYEITTPPIADEESARDYSAVLGSIADFVTKPSNQYNIKRWNATYNVADIRVIMRSSTWQKIQKSSYSTSFIERYMKGVSDDQVITIPDSYWEVGTENVSSVIISMGADPLLMNFDLAYRSSASVNEAWFRINQILTRRSLTGINPFGLSIVIKDGAPTAVGSTVPEPVLADVSLSLNGNPVDEVKRNHEYSVLATTENASGLPAGRATVALTGSLSESGGTYLSQDNLTLFVARDELAETLTLTATAVYNEEVTDVLTVNVAELPAAESTYPPYNTELVLTASNLGTISGKTITPPVETVGYTLTIEGTVGGEPLAVQPFTTPVEVLEAGDAVTSRAVADEGYTLRGTVNRTLTF